MAKSKSIGDRDEDFANLSDYEFARLRTETLFGSREPHTQVIPGFRDGSLQLHSHTWVPALWTCLRELIDNSLDELLKYGYGDSIWIEFDETTLVCEVRDNGRGLPIREIAELGKGPAATNLLSKARAGRNFKEQGLMGAGMNGVGAASVNFTSEWFETIVERDGSQNDGVQHLEQRWEEAEKGGKPIHKTKGPHVIRGSKKRSGTMVRFKPSARVYPKMILPLSFVQERVWDIAVINPKIKVHLNGTRYEVKSGRDSIISTYFADRSVSVAEIVQEKFKAKFYIVPKFTEEQENTFALVNNIPVFGGASYVDAFRTLYTGTVIAELDRKNKKEKLKFTRDMVTQGTLIYAVAFMQEPRFDSQAKVRLTSDVAAPVRNGYIESDILSLIRRNPEWIESILERAREKTAKKEDGDLAKLQREMKRTKIARLMDASHKNRSECILFVMEGDSAKGLLADTRDNNHGMLPLKGKVMNVRAKKPVEVMQDEALTNLMGSIGLAIGVSPIRRRLRYGRIYIATDEDEDGKNITALLVNFFYQFWPELFRDSEPFIYRFCTPFLILTKGREIKYIYEEDYEQYRANPSQYKGWTVLRAKGLGSLNKPAWKHVLKSPNLIPMVDDGKLGDTLSLLFDSGRESDRRDWLETVKEV